MVVGAGETAEYTLDGLSVAYAPDEPREGGNRNEPVRLMTDYGWDRLLWGVRFTSPRGPPLLLGEAWNKIQPKGYAGEPLRVLVFKTRRQAEQWCQKKRKECSRCRGWRLQVVRVRETVRIVR